MVAFYYVYTSIVLDLDRNIVSRFPLRKRRKADFALSLPRYNRICFPMPEFFAAIYAFISLADTFPRRESPAVSHTLARLSLPAQVFEGISLKKV